MLPGETAVTRLLANGWKIAQTQPLGQLHGQSLDSYELFVLVGERNRFGASYFQIFLQKSCSEISGLPMLVGLRSIGKYPAYNWFEIMAFSREVTFGAQREALTDILIQQLFQHLADLLPPGGHLMVEYESPAWRETDRALAIGIPPVATPLGYLLFSVGCGVSFKDWYFPEGGTEGPRKLQGFKALHREHAQARGREMMVELEAFLGRPPSKLALEEAARLRAKAVIKSLKQKL
ncbi:MAG: DUF1122 family protein [Chloroflexi bacterium]|nr:DUF1122 family protein [Chloroflexota bacterium]